MFNLVLTRIRQGQRTSRYPLAPPTLPDRFRGAPLIQQGNCRIGCRACAEACPTRALRFDSRGPHVDLGACLFCSECGDACPSGALTHSHDHRLATRGRDDLVLRDQLSARAIALEGEMLRLFGRSLKLRQVSAGGCNGCEADVNVLGTVVFDLARFGVQFVASPRHADGLLVTGPVTENMKLALQKTYDALPSPKLVIASGACAISGGLYAGHPEVCDGVASVLPVDLYIPGCPPHPFTVLDGLLRLLAKVDQTGRGLSSAELIDAAGAVVVAEQQRWGIARADGELRGIGCDLGRGTAVGPRGLRAVPDTTPTRR